jgi:hypothetical protein
MMGRDRVTANYDGYCDVAKELYEMTFAEVVREGIELDLDGIVQGNPLHSRVRGVMELALRWASERRDAARDDRIDAK